MKTKSQRMPTTMNHIHFGKYGACSDGDQFIRLSIDLNGKTTATLLRIGDVADSPHQAFSKLNKLGAHLVSQKARIEFTKQLQDLGPQPTSFKVATRVGPFGDAFILPDGAVGPGASDSEICLDGLPEDYLSWARTSGTVKGWREIEELAKGNSRLILALGLAFVGPLRLIAPIEPVAFQLTGEARRFLTFRELSSPHPSTSTLLWCWKELCRRLTTVRKLITRRKANRFIQWSRRPTLRSRRSSQMHGAGPVAHDSRRNARARRGGVQLQDTVPSTGR